MKETLYIWLESKGGLFEPTQLLDGTLNVTHILGYHVLKYQPLD